MLHIDKLYVLCCRSIWSSDLHVWLFSFASRFEFCPAAMGGATGKSSREIRWASVGGITADGHAGALISEAALSGPKDMPFIAFDNVWIRFWYACWLPVEEQRLCGVMTTDEQFKQYHVLECGSCSETVLCERQARIHARMETDYSDLCLGRRVHDPHGFSHLGHWRTVPLHPQGSGEIEFVCVQSPRCNSRSAKIQVRRCFCSPCREAWDNALCWSAQNLVIEHTDTAAGVGLGTFVQRRQALQADMSFHRYMSGSTSWNLFQRIALIAVCVTFPDNAHRVGDPFHNAWAGAIV